MKGFIRSKNTPDWIDRELRKDHGNADVREYYISNLIPTCYQAYCKLMNPIYKDCTVSDKTIMWKSEDEKNIDQAIFDERVWFRDLAVEYGIPVPIINTNAIFTFLGNQFPRYLSGADEGTMNQEVCRRLMNHLIYYTGDQQCYYYFDLMKVIASEGFSGQDEDYSGRLYEGSLEEVMDFYSVPETSYAPTYWWPEDKSWCITTDYDSTYSIIGGSRELIDRLVLDLELECIEVDINMRIDSKYLKELLEKERKIE